MSFLRPINRNYSWFSFEYIAYAANNMGKRYIFVIYMHKSECNSWMFILLLFCLSRRKHIQDKTRWMFIIVPHCVKCFVWYWSVFNQYSYYFHFFCLCPASHLIHCHSHMWVRNFDTTTIMVWLMTLILIHMSYFYFYIFLSYRARSSEPQVVSRHFPIVIAFYIVSSYLQVNNTTYQRVSAWYWKY